jgi:GNAT superfamily N-acetyltransferase
MIRKGTVDDIDTIVSFNYNLAYETENTSLDREILKKGVAALLSDSSKGVYWIYESEGKSIGQLMITTEWSDWRNGEFWWIQSVYIHKDHRRKGLFKALFEHVKCMAVNHSTVCGIRLYVEKENEYAKQTYQAMNMKKTHYLLYEWNKTNET